MRRSQSTRILHMSSQVPKLLYTHAGDIHDIITLRDRCSGELSIRQRRTQRHDEPREILIQREEAEEFGTGLAVGRGLGLGVFGGFLVRRHGFRVEVFDFVYVYWDTATISSACPLGVLYLDMLDM